MRFVRFWWTVCMCLWISASAVTYVVGGVVMWSSSTLNLAFLVLLFRMYLYWTTGGGSTACSSSHQLFWLSVFYLAFKCCTKYQLRWLIFFRRLVTHILSCVNASVTQGINFLSCARYLSLNTWCFVCSRFLDWRTAVCVYVYTSHGISFLVFLRSAYSAACVVSKEKAFYMWAWLKQCKSRHQSPFTSNI
jgi:hypothetical protein